MVTDPLDMRACTNLVAKKRWFGDANCDVSEKHYQKWNR